MGQCYRHWVIEALTWRFRFTQVSSLGRAGLSVTDAAPDARDGYKRGNTLFFHNYNKSCRLIPSDHAWEGTQYTILFTVKMEFKGRFVFIVEFK